jgi:transcriptional regulator with XRE-family HTH domain
VYQKFEKLLKENNTTPYQVAKATGIATSTLTMWKQGAYTPKIEKLMKNAEFFNVPVTYFLEGK